MNLSKKYFIFTTLFLIATHSYAAGGLGKSVITKIAFQSSHVFIYGDGWNNANTCQRSDAVVLHKDDQNFDKAYSLLLAAYMAGKTVGGYSDNCVEWDGKTYNTIRGHKYLTVE